MTIDRCPPPPPTTSTDLVGTLRSWAETQPDATAYTFLVDGEEEVVSWTFAELDRRARAIASELTANGLAGERALLLFPSGLDFIAAIFGCFFAGTVAVPAYPPRRNRNMQRIQTICRDADARAALSVQDVVNRLGRVLEQAPRLQALRWIATDQIDPRAADRWDGISLDQEDLAVLQYTSGSTGTPKGVMLTHGNIISNCRSISCAFEAEKHDVGMSWLPAYHDMGLVGGILTTLFFGIPSVEMSPMAFLQKPVRWLEAITKHGVTISGGPNFAYDICTKKVTADQMVGLDLSRWNVAYNGAEPVRPQTLENFAEKFAAVGFRKEAFYPCYGMAESTLIITGGDRNTLRVEHTFHAEKLDHGLVEPVAATDPYARALIGCGTFLPGSEAQIVDPDSRHPSPPGRIGEVWVRGPSVGKGYLNKPEDTAETFEATLAGKDDTKYLRTGDLGFIHENELFVSGRIKDLIIVRGVNRYPHDIELSVEQTDSRLRTAASAAFSIEIDGTEKLVVVSEVERVPEADWDEVILAIRRNVAAIHDVAPDGVVLIRPGSILKTSSGKIQRHACREAFLTRSLMVVAHWYGWEIPERHVDPGLMNGALNRNRSASIVVIAGQKDKPVLERQQFVTLQRVYHAVRDVSKESVLKLTPETNIVELGLDSLQRIEIANHLEQEMGGVFPEEVLAEIETCGEVAAAADEHLGNRQTGRKDPATIEPQDYQFAHLPEYVQLKRTMAVFHSDKGNPYFNVHQKVTRDTTMIDGRRLINFSSYNYLGMSGDPDVTQAAQDAIAQFGTSVSASRIVSGEKPVHRELEREIAHLLSVDDAVTLVGGHSTNETTIGHLFGPGDLILHDGLAHNSIIQGARLSGATRRSFHHNDWRTLDEMLSRLRSQFRRVLVVIEGVYSMDGDYPELPKFVEIRDRHRVFLMVDEAHSMGTMGATGRGIGEHFGIDNRDVDIWMGTLSKSFGSCGGYIAGCRELVEYLRYTAPGFVYSVGLSPPNAAAALAAMRKMIREPQRVARCRARSSLFLREARQSGLNTGTSKDTPIVPVIVGNSQRALRLSQRLYERGINVQPILYPAVDEAAARLRFFISSEHSSVQIRNTVQATAAELAKLDDSAASPSDSLSGALGPRSQANTDIVQPEPPKSAGTRTAI